MACICLRGSGKFTDVAARQETPASTRRWLNLGKQTTDNGELFRSFAAAVRRLARDAVTV